MSKTKRLGAIAVLLAVGLWFFFMRTTTTEYAKDTVLEGNQSIGRSERVVLVDGAKLTVNGSLTINGELTCKGGDLTLVVEGNLNANHKISCDQPVQLAISGDADFAKSSVITSATLQITDSEKAIADQDRLKALYIDAAVNAGAGPRIGPLADSAVAVADPDPVVYSPKLHDLPVEHSLLGASARAAGQTIILRGRIVVAAPPPGVKRLVLLNAPEAETLALQDLILTGPDGNDGVSDKGASCNAKGASGEDAWRLYGRAPNMKVDNVILNLGSGGNGGDAETSKDCDPGTAKAGQGGQSSNFKLIGDQGFSIEGDFIINPGKGGSGGTAIAHGKDGGACAKGGDATATGGAGADNKKALGIAGTVAGTENVQVGSLYGGMGGVAIANPGNGGDCPGCGKAGAPGGKGTATGGKGGAASFTPAGSATRTAGATDTGGDGGNANTHGGKGGNGGSCDSTGPGGPGGKGGDAKASFGKAGAGKPDGADGTNEDESGGNGGNGGDGCLPGKGGKGGIGNPVGKPGADGRNLCVTATPTPSTGVDPGRSPTPTPTTITVPPEATLDMTFVHVVPGEYSEVYLDVTTNPLTPMQATLAGPAVEQSGPQTSVSGANGKTRFTWRITAFGTYTATVQIAGKNYTKSVNVR